MLIDSGSMMQLDSLRQQSAQSKTSTLERKAFQAGGAVEDGSSEEERLKQACSDFQAIFIKQMLDTMRKTVQKQGFLQGGQGEEIFEDMLYDEYAQKISRTAGLGLDDMIYKQLSTQRFRG